MTINPWALMLGAIALEVVSTNLLSATQAMTRWGLVHLWKIPAFKEPTLWQPS